MIRLPKMLHGFVAALMVLLTGAHATAQITVGPVGQWEVNVSGQVQGSAAKGTAFVEFYPDGTLAGYALVRKSTGMSMLEGTWSMVGTSFIGTVNVSTDAGVQPFSLVGKVGSSGAMAAKMTSGATDRVSLKGKPLIALPNRSGNYVGVIRQYGLVGSVDINLVKDAKLPGVYHVTGAFRLGGFTYDIVGTALVDRLGNLVGNLDNLDTGGGAALWGKFKPTGGIGGAGIDYFDGSPIRFLINPS